MEVVWNSIIRFSLSAVTTDHCRMIKCRRMKWAGQVARITMTRKSKNFSRKTRREGTTF